jgi:hypothetical protein
LEPSWLTPTVRNLVETMDAYKMWDRMPILADALEDAGCDDRNMLRHCRENVSHVRGCWIVETLRGTT